jgi:8-oxo-dGTP pyrophosphatase MutT (NUDIX family)
MIKLMSGEKTKTPPPFEAASSEKAKVAIVDVIDGVPSILVLTRSQTEDTRPGGADWAGGKLDPGETPHEGLRREVEIEELPGVALQNITELTVEPIRKMKGGVLVISHLFAAIAELPPGGLTMSDEHVGAAWIPFDEHSAVDIPNKYRKAVASEYGGLVLNELAIILTPVPEGEPVLV